MNNGQTETVTLAATAGVLAGKMLLFIFHFLQLMAQTMKATSYFTPVNFAPFGHKESTKIE